MPLQTPYPYGIRQIMLTPYTDAQGTILANTSYPLPVAMTLGFSETEQFDELRGDDVLVAVHGRGAQVDWSLESGGLPIKAWSIISGAIVLEEGVTPHRRVRLRKSADHLRPYFRTDGRIISESGGNVNARIFRCKANGRLQADFRNGAFQTSNIDGVGLPLLGDAGRWLYEIIQNETDSPLSTTPEGNPLAIPANLTVGTRTDTTIELTWDEAPQVDGYRVQQSIDAGVTWTDVTAPNGGQPTTATTTVAGLTANTNYQFRVASFRALGNVVGEYSSGVMALTLT
ncbi:major tail protein [Mycobacterium phage Leopard]|nr:major tail protein [Mycobacterium phage Leopard]